jgi:predicted ribosome quality control (RQC) complex YloA/Tae2 family protein
MKRRETLTALDVMALARELDAGLKGAFVDKVHQIGPDDVVLKVNARGGLGRCTVLALGGRRVYITNRPVPVPERPSSFAMAARKRLANAAVESVEQVGFDRILRVALKRGDSAHAMVVELLPDGAVAILEGPVVALVAKAKVFKGRKVAPKATYAPPRPGPDPRALGASELAEAAAGAKADLEKALATRTGLGPSLAQEVMARASLDATHDPSKLSPAQWQQLANAIADLVREVERTPHPAALVVGGEMVDFSPIPLWRWGNADTRLFPSMSELLDAYFELPVSGAAKAAAARMAAPTPLEEEVARLERVHAQQNDVVESLENEIRVAHSTAESVYANYPQVENFLRLAKPGGTARQLAELIHRAGLTHTAPDFDPTGRAVFVDLKAPDGTSRRVEMELGATVNEVAQSYYRASTRAKERLRGALAALQETEESLVAARRRLAREGRVARVAEESKARERTLDVPPPPRKREWFERFRWIRTSDGHLVVAGRDAGTNDTVVKKYLKPHDRYAHADIHGAPSVVIKRTEGEDEVSASALAQACALAAIMSRAWSAGTGEASSYWVLPEQVSKTPESGESLARGAFVIRGRRNTVRHVELRAAVGGLTVNGERKALCGPPAAVAAHCDAAYLIAPGRRKATDVARELAAKIRVHPDEIARALPPGGSEIIGALDAAVGAGGNDPASEE